jgi:hypothetical protein
LPLLLLRVPLLLRAVRPPAVRVASAAPLAEAGSEALLEDPLGAPRTAPAGPAPLTANPGFEPAEPAISASFASGDPCLALASALGALVSLSGRGREDLLATHCPPQGSTAVAGRTGVAAGIGVAAGTAVAAGVTLARVGAETASTGIGAGAVSGAELAACGLGRIPRTEIPPSFATEDDPRRIGSTAVHAV